MVDRGGLRRKVDRVSTWPPVLIQTKQGLRSVAIVQIAAVISRTRGCDVKALNGTAGSYATSDRSENTEVSFVPAAGTEQVGEGVRFVKPVSVSLSLMTQNGGKQTAQLWQRGGHFSQLSKHQTEITHKSRLDT